MKNMVDWLKREKLGMSSLLTHETTWASLNKQLCLYDTSNSRERLG